MNGKKRNRSQIIGEKAVRFLQNVFPDSWVVRELFPDYGIDMAVEIFQRDSDQTDTCHSTGEFLYVQVKGTEHIHVDYRRHCICFSLDTALLATVGRMSPAIPVLLIVVDLPQRTAYYICLNDYLEKLEKNKPDFADQTSVTIIIPERNCIKSTDDCKVLRWYSKRSIIVSMLYKATLTGYIGSGESALDTLVQQLKELEQTAGNKQTLSIAAAIHTLLDKVYTLEQILGNPSDCETDYENVYQHWYECICFYEKQCRNLLI